MVKRKSWEKPLELSLWVAKNGMLDYNVKSILYIIVVKKYERRNSIKKLGIFDNEEKCFEYYKKYFMKIYLDNLLYQRKIKLGKYLLE